MLKKPEQRAPASLCMRSICDGCVGVGSDVGLEERDGWGGAMVSVYNKKAMYAGKYRIPFSCFILPGCNTIALFISL